MSMLTHYPEDTVSAVSTSNLHDDGSPIMVPIGRLYPGILSILYSTVDYSVQLYGPGYCMYCMKLCRNYPDTPASSHTDRGIYMRYLPYRYITVVTTVL